MFRVQVLGLIYSSVWIPGNQLLESLAAIVSGVSFRPELALRA